MTNQEKWKYKTMILKNLCYTDLVYDRINKKLNTKLSKKEIQEFIHLLLIQSKDNDYTKKWKNIYVINKENNITMTINSNTYRIITVDKYF